MWSLLINFEEFVPVSLHTFFTSQLILSLFVFYPGLTPLFVQALLEWRLSIFFPAIDLIRATAEGPERLFVLLTTRSIMPAFRCPPKRLNISCSLLSS